MKQLYNSFDNGGFYRCPTAASFTYAQNASASNGTAVAGNTSGDFNAHRVLKAYHIVKDVPIPANSSANSSPTILALALARKLAPAHAYTRVQFDNVIHRYNPIR